MSIKIYNGCKLPKMSMTAMLKFCEKVRDDLILIRRQEVTEEMVKLAVQELDERVMRPNRKSTEMPLDFAYKNMTDRINKINTGKLRDPAVDFESSVVLFPRKNHTLALWVAESVKMTEYWRGLKQVKDYHYQNSTDRPDDIDGKEWGARKRAWDFIDRAKFQGLTFHFTEMDIWMDRHRMDKDMIL